MRIRIGSALVALALAIAMTAVAQAQADDDTPPTDSITPADSTLGTPAIDQPSIAPSLFLTLVNPMEPDVELPLETARLTIQGMTLPGAVVSIDGDLVDTDDQG